MRKRGFRSAASLLAVPATVIALAGCGSSAPKVSSSDFISKCTGNSQLTAALKQLPGGAGKLNSLCYCVQNQLVAKGFGNRTTDDNSTGLKNAGREAGLACAKQVLGTG